MAGKAALNEQCPRPINTAADHSAEWCKRNGHCGCVEIDILRKEYGEAVYPGMIGYPLKENEMSEFNVGQTLYYVRNYRPGRLVTIEKIGRKWLTIDGGIRVDKETLQVDGKGYASPGQCWLSEEEYTQYNELRNAGQTFRDRIDRYRYRTPSGVPDGVTVEKINQASALLFGE